MTTALWRPVTILNRLREETRDLHILVERDLDWKQRVATLAAYRGLLARWYGFHATFEPATMAFADAAAKDFFAPRRKLHLLQRDLAHLGLAPEEVDALPVCRPPLSLTTWAEVLGAMYVLEGSTLGGQVIARHVERTLGLDGREGGCAYYASYGRDEVGPMWRAFQAEVAAQSSPATDDLVVRAAQLTFERLRDWLIYA